MKKNWDNLQDLFQAINDDCSYLVLRNFENMTGDDFLMDGHEDIDFLCEDPSQFIQRIGAWPRKLFNRKSQVYILFKGKKVKIDIRYVTDGYYDTKWQKEMLKNRVMHPYGFYTMNEKDYFYSLAYHAILQKPGLSEEYKGRLISMAENLGIKVSGEKELLETLKNMVYENGYQFVYPKDGTVPNRFELLGEKINGKGMWIFRKICILPIRVLDKVVKKIGI